MLLDLTTRLHFGSFWGLLQPCYGAWPVLLKDCEIATLKAASGACLLQFEQSPAWKLDFLTLWLCIPNILQGRGTRKLLCEPTLFAIFHRAI